MPPRPRPAPCNWLASAALLSEIMRAVSPWSATKASSSRSPALFMRTSRPPKSLGAKVISRSLRGAAASNRCRDSSDEDRGCRRRCCGRLLRVALVRAQGFRRRATARSRKVFAVLFRARKDARDRRFRFDGGRVLGASHGLVLPSRSLRRFQRGAIRRGLPAQAGAKGRADRRQPGLLRHDVDGCCRPCWAIFARRPSPNLASFKPGTLAAGFCAPPSLCAPGEAKAAPICATGS